MHKPGELKIWHKSVGLATGIDEVTASFPKEETYGLTAQIRRPAVSVSSDISEGAERNTTADFKRFLA